MDVADIPLIAGHPALDFVNSVEEPSGPPSGMGNYLSDYEKLVRWCARTGLLAGAAPLLRSAARQPDKARRAWAEAMDLRQQLDAVFRAIARGKPPPAEAMMRLNATLARAQAHRRLAMRRGGAIAWTWEDAEDPQVAGWQIVLSAADLLTDAGRLARVRICDGEECPWMFLDESRTGKRRWCRMNVCGNAAKVKSFRDRQRGHVHE